MQNSCHELFSNLWYSITGAFPRLHKNIFSILPQTDMHMGSRPNVIQCIPKKCALKQIGLVTSEMTSSIDKKVTKVPSSYHIKYKSSFKKENTYNWNHFKSFSKFLTFQISIIKDVHMDGLIKSQESSDMFVIILSI